MTINSVSRSMRAVRAALSLKARRAAPVWAPVYEIVAGQLVLATASSRLRAEEMADSWASKGQFVDLIVRAAR